MSTTNASQKITITDLDQGRLLEIHVNGRLTRADYDRVLPELEARMQRWPKVNYLVILDDFHGWEPAAAWADVKFDLKHREHFNRLAIVGHSAAERVGTWVSDVFLPGRIRFFDREDEAAARRWVTEAAAEV